MLARELRSVPNVARFIPAFLVLWASVAQAQNFPPRAVISVDRADAFVGETFRFDGSASFDPDEGPGALTHTWIFPGDVRVDGESTDYTFDTGGAYDVQLEVSDGDRSSLSSVTVHVLEPLTSGSPTHSTQIVIDEERDEGWAVNVDSGSVTVFGLDGSVLDEIEVGLAPRSIALVGSHAVVTNRDSNSVSVVDRASRTLVQTTVVGHQPEAVALNPSDSTLLVSLGSGELVELSADATRVLRSVTLGDDPSAIAVTHDGARAYVTHFLTRGDAGHVSVVDLASFSVTGRIELAEDPGPDTLTSGIGIPNLLGAIAIEPSARRVWVGGLKSNTGRGEFVSGVPLVPTNRLRGVLAPIDPAGGSDDIDARIDTNDADAVSSMVFDARGRFVYVAHPGAGFVSVYDTTEARRFRRSESAAPLNTVSRFDVGFTPRSLALHRDVLYVLAEHSRSVDRVDVSDPANPVALPRIVLTEEPLPPEVALGQRLFHQSAAPIFSQDNYIACASCHPGGGHDGRTWDFTQAGEGLRNTIDLRGRAGMGHGPLHWSANFDEVQDFENDIVHAFGGTGLAADGQPPHPPLGATPNAGRSVELDALSAYLSSLRRVPASPYREAEWSAAALRGRALFESSALGCTQCHAGPNYTDSSLDFTLHDVGTIDDAAGQRLGATLEGFDTPTLLGLWATAPYLHDGRAATLQEVLREHNADDQHGHTSHLSDAEVDDVVAFLLELDGREDVPESDAGVDADAGIVDAGAFDGGTDDAGPTGGGGGCATASAREGFWLLILGLWIQRRKR